MHGGKAPQTIAAARQRLLEGVEPAIVRLIKFIESPPGLCTTCGRCDDTSAIVSAIRTLLDRAGLGPTTKVEVSRANEDSLTGLSDAELAQRAEQIASRLRSPRPEALDAEVIHTSGVQIPGANEIHEDSK